MKFKAKAFFTTLFIVVCAFTSLLYVSCNPNGKNSVLDKCAAIACAHGGRCDQGSCVCPSGYDGVNCEIVTRDKYVHGWNVIEDGSITVESHYDLAIENNNDDVTVVYIKNLYNYFGTVRANILKDTIIIPNQQIQGKVIFGKGYIYGDSLLGANTKICMRYEVVDSASMPQLVDDFGYYNTSNDNSKPSIWTKHN